MDAVLTHLPHVVPAVIGLLFLGRFALTASRLPPAGLSDQELAEWRRRRAARRRLRPHSARSDGLRPQRPQ